MLNIDLDRFGRIRSRDGYDNFTASAHNLRFKLVNAYYSTAGLKQIIATAAAGNGVDATAVAYNTSGAVIGSAGGALSIVYGKGVRVGTPTSEYIYLPTRTVNAGLVQAVRWGGGVFTLVAAGMPATVHFALQSPDNRMVSANETDGAALWPSRVRFSDAGNVEAWPAANTLEITPGDGEAINSLVAWRELVFAFKDTKFAVFTGNSPGGTGDPIFNYRIVAAGLGTPALACVGRPGVFFINRRGIYLTTGSEPRLMSSPLDPLFLGSVQTPYGGLDINMAQIANASLAWVNERLYVGVATGTSTFNDTLLVWDSITDRWLVWNIPTAGMTGFRTSDNEDLVFSYATGSNHIGRYAPSFTTDDGAAIATRYQSGFYEPSPGARTTTRWTKLWGSGTPTLTILNDHATTDPLSRGGTVTLGTAPQVAKGYHLKSYQAELFSHKLSSTSGAWFVNRLEHDLAFAFQPS